MLIKASKHTSEPPNAKRNIFEQYMIYVIDIEIPIIKLRPLTHPNQDTPSTHHRRTQPPQSPDRLLKNNHTQESRCQKVRGGVCDGDLCRRWTGCEGAGEERPHDDVTKDVETETCLFARSVSNANPYNPDRAKVQLEGKEKRS